MFKEERDKEAVLDHYKRFEHQFKRRPSLRELAEFMAWKKSTLNRIVDKLVADKKMAYDQTESGLTVYKSLKVL